MRGLNPCWNVIVSLLAVAMTWGCPGLNASVATGQLTVNPTAIGFGDVLVGNSETQSGTLTNSNGTNLTILQVWVSGSEFHLSGLSLPLTLTPGQRKFQCDVHADNKRQYRWGNIRDRDCFLIAGSKH